MKNLLLALLTCWCSYLSAQNLAPIAIGDKKMDAYITARKPATLTVQIKNLPVDVKKVDIKYTLVQLGVGFQTAKYGETDATGTAKLQLDQNLPYQQIWLHAGDYLYAGIYVNEGLTVTIDAQKTPADGAYMIGEGVSYSGPDGEFNTVMNKRVLFKKKEREDLFNSLSELGRAKAKLSEAAFMAKADSIRGQLVKADSEFSATYPDYAWAVSNETLSEYYATLSVGYWNEKMPARLFAEVNQHQPYFTSNEGTSYYRYLASYNKINTRFNANVALPNTLKLFDSLYPPAKADIFKLLLLDNEKDNFVKAYPVIINSIQTKWVKHIAESELSKASATQKRVDALFARATKLDKAEIGTPMVKLPFDASLYRLDTVTNVDDFIVRLKSKFANKTIIIDFWATWCAPCLADLPFSKKLHEGNKDLPIEYVYLCTTSGSSIDVWKNKVAGLQIPGTHIFVDDKIISQLKAAFNAESGFPSYTVISANGKVDSKAISHMQALDTGSLKKIAGL